MKTIGELIESEGNEMVKIKFHDGKPYVLYAKRHPRILHWCGYIGFPKGSEFLGEHYEEMITSLNMHCGDTFSGSLNVSDEHQFIGFDCGHSIDFAPLQKEMDMKEIDAVNKGYRTLEWVWSELERMFDHIKNFVYMPNSFTIETILKGDWDNDVIQEDDVDVQAMHEQFNVQVNILKAKVRKRLEKDWA